jgi:hypothetical protein
MAIPKNRKAAEVKTFVKDARVLFALPVPKKHTSLLLHEVPFDLQLLNSSAIYRSSRQLYFALGGAFSPRVCSTMRGLSTQDLFKDEIEYTPSLSEMKWLQEFGHQVSDAHEEMTSLLRFSEISLFHEQNHRVIWRLLPPVPENQADVRRYLNFAESLVVTLDMVLGDQLGPVISETFERVKIIYHPSGRDSYVEKPKAEYRKYLRAILTATYYALEHMHKADILKAVNYVLPNQEIINKAAVKRALQLSEIFTHVTNPQWQSLYWQDGQQKLKKLQRKSKEAQFCLPADPLDLEFEFRIADRVFNYFGL